MNKLSHPVAGLLLVSILVLSLGSIYSGFRNSYGLSKGEVKSMVNGTTGNIIDQIKDLPISTGINQVTSGITKLTAGGSTGVDILGGIAALGIGALKSVFGLVTIPYSLTKIIFNYYGSVIPGELAGLWVIVVVYASFILLGAYLNRSV